MAKDPMISRDQRPTAVDFDVPISDFKLRPRIRHPGTDPPGKGIRQRREGASQAREGTLQAGKGISQARALQAGEEFLKPEKELSKPEKETGGFSPEQIEQIAQRVAELMKSQHRGYAIGRPALAAGPGHNRVE